MKRLLASAFMLFSLLGLHAAYAQDTDSYVTATSVKLRIYKLSLSKNADCSNPITIFETTNPTSLQMVGQQSTLGKGKVTPGTYNCAIVEASKVMVTAAPPTCATDKTSSICPDTWQSQLPSGTAFTCNGGVGNDQRIAIYFTTLGPDNADHRRFLPPSSPSDNNSGFKLTQPITVTTSLRVALKVITTNLILASGGCAGQLPAFKMQNQ